MSSKSKNIISWFFRLVLSLGLLWFLFTKMVDVRQVYQVVLDADKKFLVYALVIYVLTNVLVFFRWQIFIKALCLSLPFFQIVRFYMFGLFGNLFLPSSIGGDLIKIIGLCKDSTQKPKVVASVLLDRLSGFGSLVLVAVISWVIGSRLINNAFLLIPIAALALVLMGVAFILFNQKAYLVVCRLFNSFPRFKNGLVQMHQDIELLQSRSAFGWAAIGLSMVTHVIYAFNFYLVACALHQNINILYFLLFVPLLCVVSMVPSIGGLGVREAGAAFLFHRIGIEASVGVSVSLLMFVLMAILGLAGGLFYVITLYFGRVQRHS